jgi:hypothetical protein
MSQVRGRPFAHGNKFGRGRPAGSRNKATIALQELMEESGVAIVSKAKLLALQGDRTALRICVDRLLPPMKQRRVRFQLGDISTLDGIATTFAAVLRAMADGKLTPAEAADILAALERQRKILDGIELEARVKALEERNGSKT